MDWHIFGNTNVKREVTQRWSTEIKHRMQLCTDITLWPNIATNFLHFHHLQKIQVSSLQGKRKEREVMRRRTKTMTRPCPLSKVMVQAWAIPKRCPCWRLCPWGRRRSLQQSLMTGEDEHPGQWIFQACQGYLGTLAFICTSSFRGVSLR